MDAASTTLDSRTRSLVNWTTAIYALHAFSLITGIVTTATVVGAFLTGWPSILAVILNYVKRGEAQGTWLDSHFRWQIRSFWIALIAIVILRLVFIPLSWFLIGIPFLWLGHGLLGIWAIYRVARGWLALREGRILPSGGL
mgnify:CR=1 FL=1